MPPQARFEGVVTSEQQQQKHQPITMMSAAGLSERSNNPSIRNIHPRFLLAENPLKAPMNPEEVYLMRRGETLMKDSHRHEAKRYTFQKLNPPPRQFQVASSEPSRTKKFANSFLQRFRKSKYQISPAKQ